MVVVKLVSQCSSEEVFRVHARLAPLYEAEPWQGCGRSSPSSLRLPLTLLTVFTLEVTSRGNSRDECELW